MAIDDLSDNPLNIAHQRAFLLDPHQYFSKGRVNSIFSDLVEELLKEGRQADVWEVDADFRFDLRINKANLRYMG
jgi:hypothetical protein